jgi:hypothetical protein
MFPKRKTESFLKKLLIGTKSKYNKVQSAGYKDLNTIFMLIWMREKRREKRCWL